jgi:hypothetical protein
MEKPAGSRKEFIVACLRRGVPPEQIQGFLREMGVDKKSAKAWIESAKRELGAGVKGPRGPVTLEGKTATDFVLPALDASDTLLMKKPLDTGSDDEPLGPPRVSLELADRSLVPEPVKVDLQKPAPSLLVASSNRAISEQMGLMGDPPYELERASERMSENPRVELETRHVSRSPRRKSRRRKQGFLGTIQGRFALFAAGVALAWLMSDAGWLPGGARRHQTLPPPETPAPQSGPQVNTQGTPSGPEALKYPDPWANQYRAPTAEQPKSKKSKAHPKPQQ